MSDVDRIKNRDIRNKCEQGADLLKRVGRRILKVFGHMGEERLTRRVG